MEAHYPDTELRLYGTQDEADLDLAAGRVDALMADASRSTTASSRRRPGEGFAFFGAENHFDPAIHGAGVGDRRAQGGHRRCATASRAAIAAIRADGSYQKISEQVLRHRRLRRLSAAGAPGRPPAWSSLIRYAPLLASGALVTIALAARLARRSRRCSAPSAPPGGSAAGASARAVVVGLHHAGPRRARPRDAAPRLLRRPAAGEHSSPAALGFGPVDLSPFLAGVLAHRLHLRRLPDRDLPRRLPRRCPHGQIDAGRALGLHRSAVLWTVAMPQLVRFALPGYANVWQVLVKSTARRLGDRACRISSASPTTPARARTSPSSSSPPCSASISSSPGPRPRSSTGSSAATRAGLAHAR